MPARRSDRRMRTHVLSVRLTDAELDRLRGLAVAAGMPVSEIVRQSTGRVRLRSASDRAAHADLVRQVARLGSNLNQIARRVNSSRHPDRLQILVELVAIERALRSLLSSDAG